jgi:PAS domain S-box-containing protein
MPQPPEVAAAGRHVSPPDDDSSRVEALAQHLDNSPLAVIECDRECRIRYWSRQATTLFGWDSAQVLGRTLTESAFVHPDDQAIVAEAFTRILGGRDARVVVRNRNLARDGRVVHCEWYNSVLRDAEGHPRSMLSFALDITGHVRAEEQLHASEERFRLLARATNDTVWDHDLVTDNVWRSDGFAIMLGLQTDEEHAPRAWVDRIHPDDRARVSRSYREAIEGTATRWESEYRLRCADRSYRVVLDRGHIIRAVGGQPLRIIGGLSDVTERRLAAERMAEQAALIDESTDAIMVLDLDQRVLFWSRGAESLYGWTAEESAGLVLCELLREPAAQKSMVSGAIATDGEWSGELVQQARDGDMLTVLSRWSTRRAADGSPLSLLVVNTDVTASRRVEAQMLRAQRLESIGVLAGGIAHDLNNVLTPVMMSVELLKAHVVDHAGLELLDTLADSARRGADMVRQVLSFARGAEGHHVVQSPLPIATNVRRLVRDSFPKNITFELDAAPDLWNVRADSTQLQQVLMNLCVNARDAMPEGGTCRVTVRNAVVDDVYATMHPDARPGGYVVLEVEDAGVGIPKDLQERIFDPFFTTKAFGHGTGLGLSTSLAIVKGHAGFVHVYSEPGKGSRFAVFIPATVAEAPGDTVVPAAEALPRGHGEVVLVVDDEDSVRTLTRTTLERFGYRVIAAANGAEAVGLYAQHQAEIALVLTDMMMPVMDGPATIVALRAINPAVRIVGASGLTSGGHVSRTSGGAVRHFVPKPYSAETLLRIIDQALRDE